VVTTKIDIEPTISLGKRNLKVRGGEIKLTAELEK
jgi:hypothetical protein